MNGRDKDQNLRRKRGGSDASNLLRQFQVLIPADGREGAAHTGEDGMYVEALLKSYIQKFLPAVWR